MASNKASNKILDHRPTFNSLRQNLDGLNNKDGHKPEWDQAIDNYLLKGWWSRLILLINPNRIDIHSLLSPTLQDLNRLPPAPELILRIEHIHVHPCLQLNYRDAILQM